MNSSDPLQEHICSNYNPATAIGHINLFRLKPMPNDTKSTLPYQRRDFYKFMFVRGQVNFHYADRSVHIQKQALVFSNPLIPYTVKDKHLIVNGSYCIMSRSKFSEYPALQKYPVFTPKGHHVFELSDDVAAEVEGIFEKMHTDIESSYIYKEDLLVNRIIELMHLTMKLQPSAFREEHAASAAHRIVTVFQELLERQFPIDADHTEIHFKSASDFAQQLNVHVNHLNRAVKEVTQMTTSQFISERINQEAKILLRQSTWSIKEISYALGFNESAHFYNFFKKYNQISPSGYRTSAGAVR